MFNEEKVAQMAAYLLKKHGGSMRFIKLMKLMYLSDRKAMESLTGKGRGLNAPPQFPRHQISMQVNYFTPSGKSQKQSVRSKWQPLQLQMLQARSLAYLLRRFW